MKCKGIHNPSGDRDNCGRKQKIPEQRNKNPGEKSEENVQQCGKEEKSGKKERTPFKSPFNGCPSADSINKLPEFFFFLNHGLKNQEKK